MDERLRLYEEWAYRPHKMGEPIPGYQDAWNAAWAAAIQFERDRLAKLADDRLERSKAELDAGTLHVVSRIMVARLSSEEIRAGKIDD